MRLDVTQAEFNAMLARLDLMPNQNRMDPPAGWTFGPCYGIAGAFKVSHSDSDELDRFEGIPLRLMLALGTLFDTLNVDVKTDDEEDISDVTPGAGASIWLQVGP